MPLLHFKSNSEVVLKNPELYQYLVVSYFNILYEISCFKEEYI